jgi:hypothetical protein
MGGECLGVRVGWALGFGDYLDAGLPVAKSATNPYTTYVEQQHQHQKACPSTCLVLSSTRPRKVGVLWAKMSEPLLTNRPARLSRAHNTTQQHAGIPEMTARTPENGSFRSRSSWI